MNGLANSNETKLPHIGLPVEAQDQLNQMQSVLTGIEKKVNNLKAPPTPRRELRSKTKVEDEVRNLGAKMDKLFMTLNRATTEITKGQQRRKKEIITDVGAAVKAHHDANMCFYSSLVAHHPSVSPQSNGGHGMISHIDDKGNVVKGRSTGKAGKKCEEFVDLTDGVKNSVLSTLDSHPEVWSMGISADTDLGWREQDTVVLYIYVHLVGEHYQPGMRDPVTIMYCQCASCQQPPTPCYLKQ